MRQRKQDEYRNLKREAKAEGIEVMSKKYSPTTATHVSLEHQDRFSEIQELGRILYSKYGYVPHGDAQGKPWQSEIKRRAQQIQEMAVKCRKANSNESGWRYGVEQRLFDRFDIEVAW
jgi:hypothetical protein